MRTIERDQGIFKPSVILFIPVDRIVYLKPYVGCGGREKVTNTHSAHFTSSAITIFVSVLISLDVFGCNLKHMMQAYQGLLTG
ncbi:hypothetical protein BX666DRAFT_2125002 [Dichotomocladium elegans]|nr:hypothetical protein BX666DRAFT_2125002 [Dichotomocladium elegans]